MLRIYHYFTVIFIIPHLTNLSIITVDVWLEYIMTILECLQWDLCFLFQPP
jgi:hypothetical protein